MRAAVLARRRSLSPAEVAAAAEAVTATLAELIRTSAPRLVCGYVPVGSEPGGGDLAAAVRAALTGAADLLLPVLRADNDLDWARYAGTLVPAGRGLREPDGERLGRTAVADAELIVAPALAVDRRGMRLGRGGGSYDRALARVPAGVPVVALLHDGEFVDRVPEAAHDQRVTGVITPAGGLVRL
ncbi:5-formyltetrahydrofolate cyclo-ligase [Asanoa ishikariensis]|uniref:5-formyltetrahydrofolate cyclo-ligase n=1 Tax=Asanoa ishikariensis TaxID=137265 RepID=A0A1H3QNC0_9ACTN|nr:5-formyltetrahydrofolate cyclo-ligase [Asanoa ishikariensis]GIF64854.1 5-formyltetrahydrofolate cyclo-ligase [Asanoa ishikariensis]SDZ14877.1 5-formyltetrahydrofolate cyclo-ligase [Asanoa ishikariensis]